MGWWYIPFEMTRTLLLAVVGLISMSLASRLVTEYGGSLRLPNESQRLSPNLVTSEDASDIEI